MGDLRTSTVTMEPSDYKYDVAFSFLAEDEELATELNDLLQDRLRTFLYWKKQGEIAGTDGEKSFNNVFGRDARLVQCQCQIVILGRGPGVNISIGGVTTGTASITPSLK